jgi:hypothetical protein
MLQSGSGFYFRSKFFKHRRLQAELGFDRRQCFPFREFAITSVSFSSLSFS